MTESQKRLTLKPGELVALAGIIAVFIGAITLMATRDLVIALIAFGATFVFDLVALAMLMLAVTPNRPADGERQPESGND